MKQILFATLAMTAFASASAMAADLPPRYSPAPVAASPAWTGCYIGGNLGGAFANASAIVTGVGGVSTSNSGFAGGGQVGCDYQFGGGFVIGARNMFDWSSNSKSGTFVSTAFPGFAATADFKNQWFDTLMARLGYAVQPNWLLYFQGGGAWAHTTTSVNLTAAGTQYGGQISNTRSGWTIGGGAEWMFAPHWSAFLEGNYMDFGTKSGTVVTPATTYSISGKATEANVLVGVNYRFF